MSNFKVVGEGNAVLLKSADGTGNNLRITNAGSGSLMFSIERDSSLMQKLLTPGEVEELHAILSDRDFFLVNTKQ